MNLPTTSEFIQIRADVYYRLRNAFAVTTCLRDAEITNKTKRTKKREAYIEFLQRQLDAAIVDLLMLVHDAPDDETPGEIPAPPPAGPLPEAEEIRPPAPTPEPAPAATDEPISFTWPPPWARRFVESTTRAEDARDLAHEPRD